MKYIYGVASDSEDGHPMCAGLHGGTIELIPFKDIRAIASVVPLSQRIGFEDSRTHERVLVDALKNGTVIPFAFGFTAKNDTEVVNLLKRGYFVFKDAIERLEGKIQVDVVVSWNSQVLSEILNENTGLRRLVENSRDHPENREMKLDLGRKVKAALDERKKKLIPEVKDRLSKSSSASRENRIVNDDVLLNASFLLEKEKRNDFLEDMAELEGEFEGILVFRAVSPLPPYSFVDIRVEKPDYRALEDARKALRLWKYVSISEVKRAFNRLACAYQADGSSKQDLENELKALRTARDILVEYCENFPCSVRRTEVDDGLMITESASHTST